MYSNPQMYDGPPFSNGIMPSDKNSAGNIKYKMQSTQIRILLIAATTFGPAKLFTRLIWLQDDSVGPSWRQLQSDIFFWKILAKSPKKVVSQKPD